jgi:hypothetical protein
MAGKTVNSKGKKCSSGNWFGGWMVQEGWYASLNKEGQQYRIKQRIEALLKNKHRKLCGLAFQPYDKDRY